MNAHPIGPTPAPDHNPVPRHCHYHALPDPCARCAAPVDVERAGFDTLERDRRAAVTLDAINAAARANYLLEQNASDLLCLAYEYRDRLEHSCRKYVGSCRRCHVEQVLARATGVS